MRSWISAVVVACAAVLSSPAGEAQEARGTLQGRVFDATGAAVPGATVEIANVNTGVTTPTTSNEEGNYRVPFLNPGTYRVTVSLDGFSKFVSQNIELHVADVLTVDATLQAGAHHRRSHGHARRPRSVDIVGAGLGQVVDARRISELPIREGTAVELVILAPGVAEHHRPAVAQGGVQQRPVAVVERRRRREAQRLHHRRRGQRRRRSRRLQPAVGGGRGVQDPDGHLRRRGRQRDGRVGQPGDQERHQQPARPGLRMVPRRRRSTRTTTSTRKAGRPKRDYKDNRFGAAVGGPIARSRTFYFANVEANPFQVPSPVTLTRADREDAQRRFLGAARARPAVPDLRPGDDPAASDAGRPLHPRSVPRQHHPAEPHQSGRARTSSDFYPLPNQAGTADGANNYTNPTAVAFETYYTATTRVDHNLSDRHRIYGRFSWDFWEEEKDDRFDNVATGIFLNRKNRVFAMDDAYTVQEQPADERARRLHAAAVPRAAAQPGLRPRVARLLERAGLAGARRTLATFPNVTFDGYQALQRRGNPATASSRPTSTT